MEASFVFESRRILRSRGRSNASDAVKTDIASSPSSFTRSYLPSRMRLLRSPLYRTALNYRTVSREIPPPSCALSISFIPPPRRGLMDRDPESFRRRVGALRNRRGGSSSRALALGDAVHPMSPFKGQGANQALIDGPLLASWLTRSSPDAAIRGFTSQMAGRSARAVRASREAAEALHSPGALCGGEFAGVRPERTPELLRALRDEGVGAHLGERLDDAVREVIRGMGVEEVLIHSERSVRGAVIADDALSRLHGEALRSAAEGNTPSLRRLSAGFPGAVRSAANREGRTCLHLAAVGGHYHTCRWLLSEVNMDRSLPDKFGKTASEAASAEGFLEVARLLAPKSAHGQ